MAKVKKMAVGGMGGMERKPIGPAKPMPGGMERKPIGPAKPMPGFTGAPNISGSPNGMPTRGPGSSGSFMGGMERKPIGGTSPAFGGAKINPITEKVTRPAFGFGEKPTLGTGPVGTSPAPVGIGAIGSRIGSLMGGMKKGGAVKKTASGGSVSSASKRADGIAQKGKTRGKMC